MTPVPHLARSFPAAELSWEKTTAVAVKIKLKRMGKIRAPFYRIIVADARTKRDGRAIEEIGKYHPKDEPSLIEIDSERAQYWLSVGAQPTNPVRHLLEITGDWQKFKDLPGAEGTLKTAAPKPDKKEAFAAASAETVKDLKGKGDGKGRARKGASDETESASGEADKPARGGRSGSGRSGRSRSAEGKADRGKAAEGKADRGKAAEGKADRGKAAEGKADRAKAAEGTTASAGESSEDAGAEPKAAAGRGSEA
jgi:small subunit ribosomal protein S16